MPPFRHCFALVIPISIAAVACGPRIREARFQSHPPRDPAQEVTVYQERRPECAFEEVGTLTVEKRTAFVSTQEMIDALRSRARQMGGDALLGLAEGSLVSGAIPMGGAVAIAHRQTFSATVIRFSRDDCKYPP